MGTSNDALNGMLFGLPLAPFTGGLSLAIGAGLGEALAPPELDLPPPLPELDPEEAAARTKRNLAKAQTQTQVAPRIADKLGVKTGGGVATTLGGTV